ncbi:uncharacterized protein LOC133806464 [Humulus lupulus]|uniref:uncharacterized protein LOC133806464 n=1 Tax=Humulus lupulus TaxID=3486 RepID=UPI002B4116F1|nr:uncharacterized protein LOC133806464 [Humulus lupulus]
MASLSMTTLASATRATLNRPSSDSFFNPIPIIRPSNKRILPLAKPNSGARLQVQASSLKEKATAGLTAAVLTASMVVPEVAQAAGNDVSPSLKNFLLSIAAGGVVATAIIGAVVGVSNFDPVKRT